MKRLILLIVTSSLWCVTASAGLHLEVDISDRELIAYVDGREVERYEISVGNEKYPTPRGDFEIHRLIWNPSWKPPDSKWARGKEAKGPADPDNPMKAVKIFFKEPDYYIHGTADDDSLGRAESHGCIRMNTEDVTKLAQMVMEHGGKPMPMPWYRRILQRKTTRAVRLSEPIAIEIRS